MPPPPHFLLVVFPAQGHINPALQLAKRLLRMGAHVTYATTVSAQRRMLPTAPPPDGLTFEAFSDGYNDGYNSLNSLENDKVKQYLSVLKRHGSETLTHLISDIKKEGRPISCLIYTLMLPWAAEVARGLHIPSTLFWIQPATVFDIYYYYFYGYGDVIKKSANDPSCLINLPGLAPLTSRDLPSFLIPSNNYSFALPSLQEQLETLDQETKPRLLVNTCDALEPEALRAVDKFNMVAIGPSIPSAFLDGEDPNDTCFGGDMLPARISKDYKEWLNSKPESSVVYVSFGSIAVLKKPQMEEIARGLLDSGHPFLWVIRSEKGNGDEEEKLSCMEELEQQGMIVTCCSQVEVLSHPAVGCFVTHCGWNSTLESLVSGVAVVAYPQWTDQGTNAMLIEKEWRTGVTVKLNKQGVAEREEIGRFLQVVMGGGEQTLELSENVKKWKDLMREAAKDGGSSQNNLKAFVDEFRPPCSN